MDETSILAVGAAIYQHETLTDSWIPGDTGMSRVDIYFSPSLGYRIIGVDVENNQYTLNSVIYPGLVYQRVSDIFHQCIHIEEVDGQFETTSFGLNFRSSREANRFGENMDFCYREVSEPVEQGAILESDIEEPSATSSVGTGIHAVISELKTRMYQVTKEVSVLDDNKNAPKSTRKRKEQDDYRDSTKELSGDTKAETRDSLLSKEVDGRVVLEQRGREQRGESMQLSPGEGRSKETSPQGDPSKEYSKEFNKSKGSNPNPVVTQEELDVLKKELFSYIEQWKVDIISAINQKRERQRVHPVH